MPGDIVVLQAGDLVPADLRLLKCRNLQVGEAILTGESVPAEKSIEPDATTPSPASVTIRMAHCVSATRRPTARPDRVLMDLCRAAVLCHDAEFAEAPGEIKLEGDPTEGALGVLGLKAGLETSRLRADHPRDDTIPFESERRFMATLHHDHEGRQCGDEHR